MTVIHSNGSKWAGQPPDTIDRLCELLKTEPLDRTFEQFGNFVIKENSSVTFFGNFAKVSHVFNIHTDDPALIDRLTALIRENQSTQAYSKLRSRI